MNCQDIAGKSFDLVKHDYKVKLKKGFQRRHQHILKVKTFHPSGNLSILSPTGGRAELFILQEGFNLKLL